jgi:hypothetical protein
MPNYELSDLTVNIDFESHVKGKKENEKVQYQATVVFSSLEALLERGGESVKRLLQQDTRKGTFPVGRRVTVNEKGDFAQTKEEKAQALMAQISAMDADEDEAQLEAMFKIYQEKKAAKLAAEKAAFDAAKTAKK